MFIAPTPFVASEDNRGIRLYAEHRSLLSSSFAISVIDSGGGMVGGPCRCRRVKDVHFLPSDSLRQRGEPALKGRGEIDTFCCGKRREFYAPRTLDGKFRWESCVDAGILLDLPTGNALGRTVHVQERMAFSVRPPVILVCAAHPRRPAVVLGSPIHRPLCISFLIGMEWRARVSRPRRRVSPPSAASGPVGGSATGGLPAGNGSSSSPGLTIPDLVPVADLGESTPAGFRRDGHLAPRFADA